jgi:uncharacterized protein YjcR
MLDFRQRSVIARMWSRGNFYGQIARRVGVPVAEVETYITRRNGWADHRSNDMDHLQRSRPRSHRAPAERAE